MTFRDRTTSVFNEVISPHPATYDNGNFMWNFNSFVNYHLPPHTSWIRDVGTQPGKNNQVNHVVVDLFVTGLPPAVVASNGHIRTFTPEGAVFIPSLFGEPRGIESWPWIPPISAATLSNWSLGALTKFQDQVPAKFSLANSLYELRQIKGLIPTIDKTSLTKTAGNNFLAFEFGALPMISDIKTIISLSDDVDKRIRHLIDVNGKVSDLSFEREEELTTPFSFFISNDSPYSDDLTGNHPVGSVNRQGLVFTRTRCKYSFRIGGKLKQDLQGLTDANAKLKGLIAASGFNRPGRIVWNAIPYSFVVDWFFSLGKLIDTINVQPFGGEYKVFDVMWSLKSEAHYDVWNQFTSGAQGFLNPFTKLGTARVSIYERYNGFPAYSVLLTDGTLTPMQQVLGLAMLNQKRR